MQVTIETVEKVVTEVKVNTVPPDLLALAIRAEEAADSAEDARDEAVQSAADALVSEQAAAVSEGNALQSSQNAAQSASDAADALLQIGGFYDLEDAPGYDAGSAGQSITNVGGILTWQ